VLLSGDVHYGEILKTTCIGTRNPLFELTSSGLTHCCGNLPFGLCRPILDNVMTSRYHVEFFEYLNFGSIEIHWDSPIIVDLQLRNENGTVKAQQRMLLDSHYDVNKEDCEPLLNIPEWKLMTVDEIRPFFLGGLFTFLATIVFLCYRCCCRSRTPQQKRKHGKHL